MERLGAWPGLLLFSVLAVWGLHGCNFDAAAHDIGSAVMTMVLAGAILVAIGHFRGWF